jgi:hypothetical protein
MALTLGFIVVFFAAVAVAYFAGLHAARPSTATSPHRPPASTIGGSNSNLDAEATSAIAPSASKQADGDASDLEADADRLSNDERESDVAEFSDTRQFQRLAFSGTAVATIYPHQRQAGGEPMRCEVQTRDLCRGGISIVHTQRLLPQQMIVLDAVGKLLVGEVRWCRRIDQDLYLAGCRLIKTTN